MFSKKNIIITIGDSGSVIALHDGGNVKKRIFLDKLTPETKKDLKTNIFDKNSSTPIYILLDTIDQSYRKKIYPSIRSADLSRIIKRDLASDGDNKSFKNYRILKRKKSSKDDKKNSSRQECLFISVSTSDEIDSWVNYLIDLPNHLVGIYMLPIEAFNLFKLLKKSIKEQSKLKDRKNDIYFFLVENKASGMRQLVFSESQGLIFTRVVNYNINDRDFLTKYESDISSTVEYLKRLFIDISVHEVDIINIASFEVLEKLKNIDDLNLNFINYTPCKAALEAGHSQVIPKNGKFCDLLFSRIFHKNRQILKFSTAKMNFLEKFFIALKVTKYVNIVGALATVAVLIFLLFSMKSSDEKVKIAEIEMHSASKELSKLKSSGLSAKEKSQEVDIERIFDFGKTEELLGGAKKDILSIYIKLKFLKDFNVKLKKFKYSTSNYQREVSRNDKYRVEFNGELSNESGDIDNLFIEFDALTSEVKKRFKDASIGHNELPRNIDFNKKYYGFPINFDLNYKN